MGYEGFNCISKFVPIDAEKCARDGCRDVTSPAVRLPHIEVVGMSVDPEVLDCAVACVFVMVGRVKWMRSVWL